MYINASLTPCLSLSPSDRQVVMGNHRDAWVFGAVDPNSGTAGLMEIARVAGLLRKNSEWLKGRQNDTNLSCECQKNFDRNAWTVARLFRPETEPFSMP